MVEQKTKVYGVRLTDAEALEIDREKRRRAKAGRVKVTRSETMRQLLTEALRAAREERARWNTSGI